MNLYEVVTGIKGQTEGRNRDLSLGEAPAGHAYIAAETAGDALNQVAPDPAPGAAFTVTFLGEMFDPTGRRRRGPSIAGDRC